MLSANAANKLSLMSTFSLLGAHQKNYWIGPLKVLAMDRSLVVVVGCLHRRAFSFSGPELYRDECMTFPKLTHGLTVFQKKGVIAI